MDMRIEATAMVAEAEVLEAVVSAVRHFFKQVIMALSQVASFSCPSIAGTSISAVSPDYNFIGGTALGAA